MVFGHCDLLSYTYCSPSSMAQEMMEYSFFNDGGLMLFESEVRKSFKHVLPRSGRLFLASRRRVLMRPPSFRPRRMRSWQIWR